jgi:KRAB domain-containing zinc finger protein
MTESSKDLSPCDISSIYECVLQDGKKNYICKIPDCGKQFRYKSEIIRHTEAHSNFRPFTCTFPGCLKSFKRNEALECHMRIHTKETPYKCSVESCGKEFITRANLRYHMLKHQDDKSPLSLEDTCQKS